MIPSLSLFLILYGVWLSLSGHYTDDLLTIGAICCALIVFVARRMRILDAEGLPLRMVLRFVAYIPWLVLEMIRSAFAVAKLILHPSLPITPVLYRFQSPTKTDLGHFIFGNSITFTPGTTTCEIEEGEFLVYAITREGAEGLEKSEMAKKCCGVEGSA
jgi:multicomponent Na+:H+ antiporter subunit E